MLVLRALEQDSRQAGRRDGRNVRPVLLEVGRASYASTATGS